MRRFSFVTVDVFTDTRFGGNQLAVFTDARGLAASEMQALAAEMNYSETTFVLPPDDPANSARVRIFHRTAEMPFAGHPNVGTGFVLATLGRTPQDDVLRFEELAGLVEVRVERDAAGQPVGAVIDAPQPLQVFETFEPAAIAACLGIPATHVVTGAHAPVRASVGVDFVLVEVSEEGLVRAAPDLAAFRRLAGTDLTAAERLSIHLYSRDDARIRARMFAPLSGTWEDPATGSANATLGALLLSLTRDEEARFEVTQGIEMGRPSTLHLEADKRGGDVVAVRVGGGAVRVGEGTMEFPEE